MMLFPWVDTGSDPIRQRLRPGSILGGAEPDRLLGRLLVIRQTAIVRAGGQCLCASCLKVGWYGRRFAF